MSEHWDGSHEKTGSRRWTFLRSMKMWNKKDSKRKAIIDELLASNHLMTSSLSEQTKTISALSIDNGRYEAEKQFLQKRIDVLGKEKADCEEQFKRLQTDRCRVKRSLQTAQSDLRVISYQKRDMKADRDKVMARNDQLKQTRSSLEGQLMDLQGKYDRMKTQYDDVTGEKCSLKEELEVYKHKLLVDAFIFKLLTDDRRRQEEATQRKEVKISRLQDEKLQLVNYFNCKFRPKITDVDNNRQMTAIIAVDSMDRNLDHLQTKLLEVECRLFRRSCLVQDLISVIRSYDPTFCIHDNPHLRIYADEDDTVYSSDIFNDVTDHV